MTTWRDVMEFLTRANPEFVLRLAASVAGDVSCPGCKSDTEVIESRRNAGVINRLRYCSKCDLEFATREIRTTTSEFLATRNAAQKMSREPNQPIPTTSSVKAIITPLTAL